MMNFEYYAPTRVLFGKDTELRTGELIREAGGTKVLVHYGGGSVVRSGLMDRVLHSLEDAGLPYTTLGGCGSQSQAFQGKRRDRSVQKRRSGLYPGSWRWKCD